MNFFLVGYGYQTGEVLFDPSLPFTDVNARINGVNFAYGRSFALFGRTASVIFALPYAWGNISGNVAEVYNEIYRSGLADLKFRGAINILGGPALTPREFAARTPETILGVSLSLSAPTGQYDPAKLINIGTNRWAFKPEVGFSQPSGPWTFEAYAGVFLFLANNDFYGGVKRTQDPLYSFQAHVAYTIRTHMWVSLDGTYYTGGQTTTGGVVNDTRQANSRVGLTFVLPLAKQHSLKFAVAKGATARIGANFTTYAIAYQFLWFD